MDPACLSLGNGRGLEQRERFLCGDIPSVQPNGLGSAGGCSQPGSSLIHSAREGFHSPLVEAWPSRRAWCLMAGGLGVPSLLTYHSEPLWAHGL